MTTTASVPAAPTADRATRARSLAASAAMATGCMLEPTLRRTPRTMSLLIQAGAAADAVACRTQLIQMLGSAGFDADVELPSVEHTPGMPPCWTVLVVVAIA